MKKIGLDVGNKRIGVAISDELSMFAHPLYTIARKGIERDLEEIKNLVEEHQVDEVVIGLPKNMDGSVGFQGDKTLAFAERLQLQLKDVKITFWDERLSTKTAKDIMLNNGIKQEDKKKIVDTIAAVVILDNYLSSVRKGL